MAAAGPEQEEAKKSLGYYLHWVLAREAGSGKTNPGKSGRKDRATRKKTEQKLIARALSKVVFHHIISSDDTGNRYLQGLDGGGDNAEDFLVEKAHNEYDVKIWLKTPVPRGAFQVVTGKRHGLEPGQAKFRICASMTKEERMHARSNWSLFVDEEDCLAPAKIHEWLKQLITVGFRALHGKVFRKRKLSLVLISADFPTLRIILSCTSTSNGDDHDVFSIIYNVTPAVRGYGFPTGACLQHPFPRQMPYSLHGQELLRRVQEEIQDGDVSFMLEIPPGEKGEGGIGSRPATQPAVTKRAAIAAEQKEADRRKVMGQIWRLSLGQLDEILLKRALQTGNMKHAITAQEAFTAIKQSKGSMWQVISPEVQCAAMLWTMKKTAQKNKNASDWFVAFMGTLQKFLVTKFCPQFLQMNVNALTAADLEAVENAEADIAELLQDIEENPTNLLKHYLHKK